MKMKLFLVWLNNDVHSGAVRDDKTHVLVEAQRAIVTVNGRLKFVTGFWCNEVAGFIAGSWKGFHEIPSMMLKPSVLPMWKDLIDRPGQVVLPKSE